MSERAANTSNRNIRSDDTSGTMIPVVQCVCGRLKQAEFICDFCYSMECVR